MPATAPSPEVAPLVSVLSREQATYQELLEVATEERQAIVDGNLPELKTALQRKQDVLEKLSRLEDRRISWVRRYTRKHDSNLDTLTLAAIIEASEPNDAKLLTRLHTGLRDRIDRLVETDAVTKTLLERILSSIDMSLRFLLADDASGQTYGAQGRLQTATVASRQLLERQA